MFKLIENPYLHQEIGTIIVLVLYFIFRISSTKLVRKYAKINSILEHRANLVIKYIHLLLNILAFISIISIFERAATFNPACAFLSYNLNTSPPGWISESKWMKQCFQFPVQLGCDSFVKSILNFV